MKQSRWIPGGFLLLAALAVASRALAGDPPLPSPTPTPTPTPIRDVSWWSVDSGVLPSSKEQIDLFGSVGQADPGIMYSENYSVGSPSQNVLGDINGGFLNSGFVATMPPSPTPPPGIESISTPIYEQCCPTPIYSDPTATAAVGPTPALTPEAQDYVRNKYQTVGKAYELNWADVTQGPINSTAPRPVVESSDATNPTTFVSPLTSHYVYQSGLWGNQESDFAPRTIRMIAGTITSVSDFTESGTFSTRGGPANPTELGSPILHYPIIWQRYGLGGLCFASIIAGGKLNENVQVIGRLSRASSALDPSASSSENYIHTLQGADERALISGDPSAESGSTIDPRAIKIEGRNPVKTFVSVAMKAFSPHILIDSKYLPGYTIEYDGRQRAVGFIERATSIQGIVASRVPGSSIRVRESVGASYQVSFDEDLPEAGEGQRMSKTPEGEPLGNFIGVQLDHPENSRPWGPIASWEGREPIPVLLANGLLINSQEKGSPIQSASQGVVPGSGSPVRNYPLRAGISFAYLRDSVTPESGATILAQDSAVVGDGASEIGGSGYDTDGIIAAPSVTLQSRAEHPALDSRLAKSDRVGLLYCQGSPEGDLDLRITLAAPRPTPSSDWKDSPVVWGKLVLETKALESYEEARVGVAPIARRLAISSITYPGDNCTITFVDGIPFQNSDLGASPPSFPILWRRLAFGRSKLGQTSWSAANVTKPSGGSQPYLTIPVCEPGVDGNTCYEGQVVELLYLVGPCGTSFSIRRP
jgi:hypothetical protein